MLITDSQVHVWQADPEFERRHGVHPHRRDGFYVEELLAEMEVAGVDRAVLIPATLWTSSATEYALAAARKYTGRFAIVDHFDPLAVGANLRIENFRQGDVRGLRLALRTNPQWLEDGAIEWVWSTCERLNLPVMLFVGGMADKLNPIAARHPGLKLIVDHMDRVPNKKGAEAFAAIDGLLGLARHANVAVKMTAAPGCSAEDYPFRDIYPFLKMIYEAFGPNRLMWGSDVSGLACTYSQCVDHFRSELDFLTDKDREWVLGKTIATLLDWPEA